MKKQAILILIFIGSLISNNPIAYSQSDTPCGATPQTLGSTCTFTTHDATGYTKGPAGGTPSCGVYGSTLVEEDTWYAFVAPASGSANIETATVAGSAYDYADMVVYSGTCTSLTELDCFSGYGGAVMPHFQLTGLTPGVTYFVRLYGDWNQGGPKTIDYCAYAAPPVPTNDECLGAIPVTVNSNEFCNIVTPGTISGATASPQSTFCPFGVTPNDDVWFSFVATNNLLYFHLLNIVGSTPDLSYSLHSGTCASTNLGLCDQGLGGLFNNLTVGDTYYLRVFSTGSSTQTATFDLCITLPPVMPPCATNPPPGNTACTATPICNINGYCGTTSGSYTIDTWPDLSSAFCAQIDNNSFLSFTAAASTISFYVWTTSSTTGAGIQIFIFSANNCGSGPVTPYSCWNPGSANTIALPVSASGLTVGNEYYIMIDGQSGDVADYTIAAFEGIQTHPEISSVSGDTNICLGQSIDLYATGVSAGYTWSPSTYLNTTAGDTVTSTPTNTGSITYSVTSLSPNPQCPSATGEFVLTVTGAVTGTDTVVTCGSYIWIDGLSYTTNNTTATHTIIGGSANGCDSIVTLDLTISNSVTGTDTQAACGSYTWIDGNIYTSSNSTATNTLVGGSVNGCDSIITLDLTIHNSVTSTDTHIECDSYTWIDGINYTSNNSTATHTIIGGSVTGCDSIITLNLTISSSATSTDAQVACNTYTWIDGISYTTSNSTATHTLIGASANGCDSIISLNLTISNSVTSTDTQAACDSYTWIDGNKNTNTKSTATHTLIAASANGCDSIITLNLTISNSATSTDTQAACGSYTWIDGNNYTISNSTATHTLIGASANGCDSIITLNLTISNSVSSTDTQVACGSYTWIDGISYTANNTTAIHTIIGGSIYGCDSIITLNLTISNSVNSTDKQEACGTYTWVDGNTYTSNNNTATHTIVAGSPNGCDEIITLDLTILPSPVIELGEDFSFCEEPIQLSPGNDYVSYMWNDGSSSPSITIFEDGIYEVTVTDINGCSGSDYIRIIQDCLFSIWVPNSFTPNGDGLNDLFVPVLNGVSDKDYGFYIFNRWGEVIFEGHNLADGWDGTINGDFEIVQTGVYVWKIVAVDMHGIYHRHTERVNVLK
jgi:gliding motility-associated-like protein